MVVITLTAEDTGVLRLSVFNDCSVRRAEHGRTDTERRLRNVVADREFVQRLIDFFDPWDLVEFLQLKTEDVVFAFQNEIDECSDELEELMTVGVRKR